MSPGGGWPDARPSGGRGVTPGRTEGAGAANEKLPARDVGRMRRVARLVNVAEVAFLLLHLGEELGRILGTAAAVGGDGLE